MAKNNEIAALMAERDNAVALAESTSLPTTSAVAGETHAPVQALRPRNKGGRPRAADPMDKRVSLSITQSLYKRVAAAAQQDRRSINAYLTGIIEDAVQNKE